MDVPIGVGNCIDAEKAVLATILDQCWHPIAQTIAIDAAIHHHVRDVDAEGPVLARHALRDHAKASLGGREMREPRHTAQTPRSAREDNGAAPERRQSARCLAADQKAAKAANSPKTFELRRCQLTKIDALIVAGVKNDKVGRVTPVAGRYRPIEQADDIVLACRVHRHGFGAATAFANRLDDLRDLLGRSAGDDQVIALGREAPAQCGAEPAFGTDTYDDGGGRAHDKACFSTLAINSASSPVPCISRTMSQPPTNVPLT